MASGSLPKWRADAGLRRSLVGRRPAATVRPHRQAGRAISRLLTVEDMEMNTFDLSPLFRSTVGFERLNQLIDSALATRDDTSYPPYNIEVTDEDNYRITI